jgi:hypothetical protein
VGIVDGTIARRRSAAASAKTAGGLARSSLSLLIMARRYRWLGRLRGFRLRNESGKPRPVTNREGRNLESPRQRVSDDLVKRVVFSHGVSSWLRINYWVIEYPLCPKNQRLRFSRFLEDEYAAEELPAQNMEDLMFCAGNSSAA